MPNIIVGIMGPGSKPTKQDLENAYQIGKFSAENDLSVLTGGYKAGVMNEALKGAKEAGGDTIAVLAFGDKTQASDYADHVIITAMGSARNNINVLSSDIVVACGIEAGTLSEIALALKAGKRVILLTENDEAKVFLKKLAEQQVIIANTVDEAKNTIKTLLQLC